MSALNFEEILLNQIRFLKDSSQSFDRGFDDEALRLAVTARVLVHDTKKSHSLMGQMGLLTPTTSFYSAAARWDPDNFAPHHGLLQLAIGSGGASSYRAPLDDRHPGLLQWIPFVEWWSEVVIDDRKGNRLTRKELVLASPIKRVVLTLTLHSLRPMKLLEVAPSGWWNLPTAQSRLLDALSFFPCVRSLTSCFARSSKLGTLNSRSFAKQMGYRGDRSHVDGHLRSRRIV